MSEESLDETDAVLTCCCRYIGPTPGPVSHDLEAILQHTASAIAAQPKVITQAMMDVARLCEPGTHVPVIVVKIDSELYRRGIDTYICYRTCESVCLHKT